MRHLSALLLLMTVSPVQAGTLSLAEALKPYKKSYIRSFYGFHYASRNAVKIPAQGILDPSLPELKDHVRDWANYYWDLSQPGGTGMIRGLYLASDPVVSRHFGTDLRGSGQDQWLLYRVGIAAGSTYLDMTDLDHGPSETIPAALVEKLKAQGCDENEWQYLIYKSFNRNCRAIALQTLRDLDVTYIQYSWTSTQFSFCKGRAHKAFILLRPEKLRADSVRMFYRESPLPGDELPEARSLEAFFGYIVADPSRGGTAPQFEPEKFKLWPALDEAGPSPEFEQYVRQNLIDCQS